MKNVFFVKEVMNVMAVQSVSHMMREYGTLKGKDLHIRAFKYYVTVVDEEFFKKKGVFQYLKMEDKPNTFPRERFLQSTGKSDAHKFEDRPDLLFERSGWLQAPVIYRQSSST